MANLIIKYLEIILPSAVLLMSFLLKMCVGRPLSVATFIDSLIELPIDAAFLAISFLIAYIITSALHTNLGIALFMIYICATILVIIGWRGSIMFFDKKRFMITIILTVACFAASATGLIVSINLLTS
jgi:hypothetical protein